MDQYQSPIIVLKNEELKKLARPSRPLSSFGFAIAVSVLAGLMTHTFSPFMGSNFSELFQAAVVLSAWYGGLNAGLTAATASFLIYDYFFIPPLNAFTGHKNLFSLCVFAVVAVLTGSLSGKLKKAKSDLESAYDDLENRIRQRTAELSQANSHLTKEILQRAEAEKTILEISNHEQQRLGHDLHDGLCQTLAGVKLMAEEVKCRLEAQSVNESKELAKIEALLAAALTQADTVARGLYPVELETNGLMSALEELATKISKAYSVKCVFKCWHPVDIKDAAKANHIYRIAQEAVINAIKSGKAKRINIHLNKVEFSIALSVADNGIGLKNGPYRKGMGLKIMEYRARMIGGQLKFQSRSKGRTRVSCSFNENG